MKKKIYNCQYCKKSKLSESRSARGLGCSLGHFTNYRGNNGSYYSTIRIEKPCVNGYKPIECEDYEPCLPYEDLKEALLSCYNKEGGIYYEVNEHGYKIK